MERKEKEGKQSTIQGLKCLYCNADQLLNKLEDLKTQIADECPDIMLFTEVIPKAQRNPIFESQLNLPGYEPYVNFNFTDHNLGASGKRGVAIFVKSDIQSEEVNLTTSYDDQLWVEVKLKGADRLLCGCVYRSPTKDKQKTVETTQKVCEILKEASQRGNSHLLICGDFNYPGINWENEHISETTPVISPFIEAVQSCFLHQHVFKPTRYRDNQEPSLLDLVFTNEEGMLQELTHRPGLGESDHECLNFLLNCYKEEVDQKPTPNFLKGDYITIRGRLQGVEWVQMLQGEFIESYSAFIQKLGEAMDGCIPNRKTAKMRKSIYLTNEAMRKKDLKNKLWRRYKKTKSTYDYARYKGAKNSLRTLSRRLREEFEKSIAADSKSAPKKFWSYVKSRTKTRSKIPSLKRKNGLLAVTASERAEALNEFFATTFTVEDTSTIPETKSVQFKDHLNTFVITPAKVLTKLRDLNPGKNPGLDGWHPLFLKHVADLIAEPLAILYQKSLNEGVCPEDWLEACVTAIHKKGEKKLPDNYRPVSMTSIICKLMESIVRDEIVEHMIQNDLFSKLQHGFVPHRDCMTNLLTCIELWTEKLESGDAVDVIYTDFSKAFDSVPHQRLLKKMESLGIRGVTLNWVKAFLSNRRQCVRVENELSNWISVISGIPQGSVLGPTLFVIFINDMPEMVESICQLFADDAKIFRSVHLRDETGNLKLQEDLENLDQWSQKWQLPFNTCKCKVLHLGHNNPCYQYKMKGQKLQKVEDEKDLGVVVDNELKFHKHTASVVKKANMKLGLIKKSFASLDETTLPLLYSSLVRSQLEYGNVIWGPHYKTDSIAVEKVQRRATKLIQSIKNLSYEQRLRHLKLPSLQHRRRRGDMIFAYKLFTGQMGLNKDDFFASPESTARGHSYRVIKRKATKLCRIHAFSNRIIDDWNGLPQDIVAASSTNAFKNALDKHWEEEMFATPF